MKASMEAQAEYHITLYQTRLFTSMELEKDQFKISFSHPSEMTVGSSSIFKTVNLTVDVKKITLPDKVNLHMQIGKLIVNYLT